MKRILFGMTVLLIALSACSPAAPSAGETSGPAAGEESAPAPAREAAPARGAAPVRQAYENYTATFVIDFDGSVKWQYRLQTRRAGALLENSLHIEGVPVEQNPGDVRIVTDGATTWMTGLATDNECVQFPNGAGMDPSLIHPETLVPLADLPAAARMVREETFAGKPGVYYSGGPASLGRWKDALVEYRVEKDGGGLLQFALLATGEDPVFGAGAGSIMATYKIESLEAPAIEPVAGCEISVPLPDNAANYVRLPGLASFESPDDPAAVAAFYQSRLPQEGWSEQEPPAQADGVTVLSYQRGAEQVEIHIQAGEAAGSRVELIFLQ